jgi:hypothetical protein
MHELRDFLSFVSEGVYAGWNELFTSCKLRVAVASGKSVNLMTQSFYVAISFVVLTQEV